MSEEQKIAELKIWIENLKDYCDSTGHPDMIDFARGISAQASEVLELVFNG